MNVFKKFISSTIMLTMLISVFPVNAAGGEAPIDGTITKHTPQSRILEEKEIPDSGGTNWVWIVLGGIVVVAGVAALAGSSGDSGGSSSSGSSTATGDVTVSW